MSQITLRILKGAALSQTEMDNNFRSLINSASVTGTTGELTLFTSESSNPLKRYNVLPTWIDYSGSVGVDSGVASITGSLNIQGDITAQQFNTQIVSSSTIFESGSTIFGDDSNDTHRITGSLLVTGSQTVTGSLNVSGQYTTSNIIEASGQSSKIRFHYDEYDNLPSATTWHGMFAHVHATGSAYYAHGGTWVRLAQSASFATPIATLTAASASHETSIITLTAASASHETSINALNAKTLISSSTQIDTDLFDIDGLVSSSAQVDALGFLKNEGDSVVSSSAQITAFGFPVSEGGQLVSSSTQIDALGFLKNDGDSVVSSSAQLEGFVSSSGNFITNELIVATNTNAVTSSNLLSIDSSNGRVGIGTSSPSTKLHIAGDGANEGQVRLQQANDGGDGPDFAFYTSRGTIASPSSVQDNDVQGRINAYAYNGSSFVQGGSFGWSSDGTDGDSDFSLSTRVGDSLGVKLEVTNTGAIRFNEAYTFPTSDGTANQVLQTDGSGAITFGSVTADYSALTNVPSNIVSSSTQVDALGFLKNEGDTVISSSAQITALGFAGSAGGTVSGSAEGSAQGTIALNGVDVNINAMQTGDSPTFATITATTLFTGSSLDVSAAVTASAALVNGAINATGDITAFFSSDERLKDNITPIEGALDKINQIGGYGFDWNDNSEHSGHDVGVIAQEIEKVLPEVVVDRDNGYKAVRYDKIVALLINAVKEQQLQIDELKSKL